MQIVNLDLEKLLINPGHISEDNFSLAKKAAVDSNTALEIQLVKLGFISDYNLWKTIADTSGVPFIDLSTLVVEKRFFKLLPEIVARAQRAVVYGETAEAVLVATLYPDNYEFKKLLEKKTGKEVRFSFTSYGTLNEVLDLYEGDYDERVLALLSKCEGGGGEQVVVDLVNLLLEYGYQSKASDIHLEPRDEKVRIRFRIDGVLHEVAMYPKYLHEQISFRIKILSRLQTDEREKTQDGRFSYSYKDHTIDIRVSIIPVTNGENIVMRLLSTELRRYTLNTLSLTEADRSKILHALTQPHGMILAVGPTGSGKTTVLYTIAERLNRPEVNIMTIEDPVEYDIENVQQTQVNPGKDITFANGLRSIVRQDPDIIMVGEIRDEDTADIAINAALTGHLLLSTLHTNDAATTFPRLMEMGVESFLVASSIRIVVSVRLVRRVCKHCKESHKLSAEEISLIKNEAAVLSNLEKMTGAKDLKEMRFYRGAGCESCHQSGFDGRIAIFEILEVSEEIRLLISKKASSDEIHKAAVAGGMKTLLEDGLSKALLGHTTVMEVIKATYQ